MKYVNCRFYYYQRRINIITNIRNNYSPFPLDTPMIITLSKIIWLKNYKNAIIKLTIARNLRNDISSSLLSLELMANLEALIAFFDSADFKFDLILQHLNAFDGDGDRTVFRCLFQRSATSRSLSFDCNKQKLFETIQYKEKLQ